MNIVYRPRATNNSFIFNGNRQRDEIFLQKALENNIISSMIFQQFAKEKALWLLSGGPKNLFSIFSKTVNIVFEEYQHFLTQRDIMLFKQVGRRENKIKTVLFKASGIIQESASNNLINSAAYLARAKVTARKRAFKGQFSGDYEMVDEFVKITSNQRHHLYRLLLSEKNTKFIMNNSFRGGVDHIQRKLIATACERNGKITDLLSASGRIDLGRLGSYLTKIIHS